MPIELWVRTTSEDSLHFDIWQRDQVILVMVIQMQDSMSNLLDVDAATERDLLPREAFGSHAVLSIPEIAGRDRGVMADLLADQPAFIAFGPYLSDEELAEESIERFLDAFGGVSTGILLSSKGGKEPFEDEQTSGGWVRL